MYRVHPLPESLIDVVSDFGSLSEASEVGSLPGISGGFAAVWGWLVRFSIFFGAEVEYNIRGMYWCSLAVYILLYTVYLNI